MRWIGVDEAGYGPNLGPMVLVAVVAEGPGPSRPDPWGDCPAAVCRAGGPADRLWIDDSKRLYKTRLGLARLEAAAGAVFDAAGLPPPDSLIGLLDALGVDRDDAELAPWLPDVPAPALPIAGLRGRDGASPLPGPFSGAPWRLAEVRGVFVGPARFNEGLRRSGSKAEVHFGAFARLLRRAWDLADDGRLTLVRSDKHGGRHFYADLIRAALPPCSIAAGPEGADLSRYELSDGRRRLTLELLPRADADDGLVALASIVAKLARERWMAAFNAYWAARVPALAPTAGYPTDAARFRRDLLAALPEPDPPVERWWRAK